MFDFMDLLRWADKHNIHMVCLDLGDGIDFGTPEGKMVALGLAQPVAADGTAARDAFESADKTAPWYSQMRTFVLDGAAVIVKTELTKSDTDKAAAVKICDAAYQAAMTSGTEFRSVAVRSAADSTLAHRNELSGDTACRV